MDPYKEQMLLSSGMHVLCVCLYDLICRRINQEREGERWQQTSPKAGVASELDKAQVRLYQLLTRQQSKESKLA